MLSTAEGTTLGSNPGICENPCETNKTWRIFHKRKRVWLDIDLIFKPVDKLVKKNPKIQKKNSFDFHKKRSKKETFLIKDEKEKVTFYQYLKGAIYFLTVRNIF